MGFTCTICGRYHDRELLDVRAARPEPLVGLSDEQLARDGFWEPGSDFAALWRPERRFARALVELPIPELGERFAWGVWVELRPNDAAQLAERYDDGEGVMFDAVLATALPAYGSTVGLPGRLTLRREIIPAFTLGGTGSLLELEQAEGITLERARELAEPYRQA